MRLDDLQIELRSISQYRTELMGCAIIGVLIMHLVSIGNISHAAPVKLLSIIPSLAFTETFLILSGLGIYHSLSSCNGVILFYKKRYNRIVIPYLLMAFVPVLLYVIFNKEPIWMYLYRLSMIDFWIGDGSLGMWYVAVSILLYLLAPWLFKYGIFDSVGRLIISVGGGIIVLLIIYYACNSYWESTGKWLAQIPAFLLGGFLMCQINKERKLGWKDLIGIITITFILFIFASKVPFLMPFSRILVRFCGLIMLCILVHFVSSSKWFIHILQWFGTYSLELYILHLLLYQPFKNFGLSHLYLISISIGLSILLCQPVHKLTKKIIENDFKQIN